MKDDKKFLDLVRQISKEHLAMDESAQEDAKAMLARIVPCDPDPIAATYQLFMINNELKHRINFYSLVEIIEIVRKDEASALGKKAADQLHSKPGGNRDKAKAIRAVWAAGKYSSRDICAEQECAALGMSFSTARKALRGTPDPA